MIKDKMFKRNTAQFTLIITYNKTNIIQCINVPLSLVFNGEFT